jgi:hypothetical protein
MRDQVLPAYEEFFFFFRPIGDSYIVRPALTLIGVTQNTTFLGGSIDHDRQVCRADF